jgi:hypothetical protein
VPPLLKPAQTRLSFGSGLLTLFTHRGALKTHLTRTRQLLTRGPKGLSPPPTLSHLLSHLLSHPLSHPLSYLLSYLSDPSPISPAKTFLFRSHSKSPALQTVVRWSICRDLSCKMRVFALRDKRSLSASVRAAVGRSPCVWIANL